jgi:4-amino-4-deoxy-L-arabinose transferase-like glycosyltransferase
MRRHLPCIVILGVYLFCIVVANPRGEFPLNDDWSYTRSAFVLGSGEGLKIDPWTAPSLVGQTLYGGLLAKIFAPSFLVLRVSTLVLSCSTLVLLWGILLRIGFRRDLACIILLAWAFNPLQFSLSFTYMTEIPFVFFLALALCLYVRHLDTGQFRLVLLSAATLGYAFLIRQTALLFILALVCSVILDTRKSIWERIRQALPAAMTSGFFVALYYLWILLYSGATPAVRRKLELLSQLKTRQAIGNSYGMFFYLAFMMVPILIFLVPALLRLMRDVPKPARIAIPVALGVVVLSGLAWFHAQYRPFEYLPSASYHARMPLLLNVLYDSGLGPITLDPDYFGPPPTPTYPAAWYLVTGIVAAGAVFCGALCCFGLLQLRALELFRKRRPLLVFLALSFLLLSIFEIVMSHLQEGGLFDRHILVVAFPFSLLIGFAGSAGFPPAVSSGLSRYRLFIPAGIAIAAMAAFCVAATHDYMEWNRIRWEMGRGLLAQGIDPLTIVGGFEFNAWNNYDTFVERGRTAQTNHWWYDKRDYIISMNGMEGYEIQQSKAYFSWVHRRPVNIYLIRDSKFEIRD